MNMFEGLNGFDVGNAPPRRTLVPAGEYQAVVSKLERKNTKANDGSWYIAATLKIVSDGPAKGRELYDILNLGNRNAQAVEMAKAALAELCLAVGAARADEKLIVGKGVRITVSVRDGKTPADDKQNSIKRYDSILKKKVKAAPPVSPTKEAEEFFGVDDQAIIDHANQTDMGEDDQEDDDTDTFVSPFDR